MSRPRLDDEKLAMAVDMHASQVVENIWNLHGLQFQENVATETPDTTPEDEIPVPERPSRFVGKARSGNTFTSARHGLAMSSWASRIAPDSETAVSTVVSRKQLASVDHDWE